MAIAHAATKFTIEATPAWSYLVLPEHVTFIEASDVYLDGTVEKVDLFLEIRYDYGAYENLQWDDPAFPFIGTKAYVAVSENEYAIAAPALPRVWASTIVKGLNGEPRVLQFHAVGESVFIHNPAVDDQHNRATSDVPRNSLDGGQGQAL